MEKLKEYEFSRGSSSGRGPTRDYEKLFDGGIYRLTRGEDFGADKKIKPLRNYLSAVARKAGKTLRTQIEDDDNLVIRAEPRAEGDEQPKRRGRGRPAKKDGQGVNTEALVA